MVVLSNKHHAKCDYCGSTEGTDWIKGEFKLYCSSDCKRAADIPAWSCAMLVFSSLTVTAWTQFGLTNGFSIIFVCGSITVLLLIAVIRGIQARERVAHRSYS